MRRSMRLEWCAALVLAHAGLVEAAPPRGYEGPGHVESPSDDAEGSTPVEPGEGGSDPHASDEPGDAGPPATDAADSGISAKSPADLERAAEGEPPKGAPWMPRHRIVYRNLVAGRVNPLGAVDEITLGYRLQLVMRDTELFRDSFLFLGGHLFMTPAFARVGPTIEVQPAAVLNLSATYDFVGMFGAFGQARSFRTPTVDYGPDELRRVLKTNRGYATYGQLATLSALFQAKVRSVAFRNQIKFFWASMKLHEGDTVFVDLATDIMAPNNGWTMTNDTDLVYLFEVPVSLVLRHTLTTAFYRQRDFLPGEPVSQPNGPTSRLGPAVAWTIFDYPGARFNRPTVFLLAQWWLRHRWRTGAQVHAAVPYAVVGFSFEGDIWRPRERPPRERRGVRRRR
ncbi:MAG TPA: hypothetical protein VFG69_11175 [Nannocystaceae bacterium]|nr:hypothetical protein [Nannocystaceae bacterium]